MNKFRIKIESECEQCDGYGLVAGLREANNLESDYEAKCPDCDGTGWLQSFISLDELKSILDSGE